MHVSPGDPEFAKGCLLGFVVFTVYDILMHRDFEQEEAIVHDSTAVLMSDRRLVWMHSAVRPNSNDAPLLAHCGAGAVSGMAFSMVLDGWDVCRRVWNKGRADAVVRKLNTDFLLRRMVHHTLGYATLFGSYECFRRVLVEGMQSYFFSCHPSVPVTLQYAERCGLVQRTGANQFDMTAVPMLTAFFAGGFAGQAHFVADHYTRNWKLQAIQKNKRRSVAFNRLPLRPMMASFLPTALCFVAFQYGAELYDRVMEDEQSSYAYPDNNTFGI